MIASTRSKPNPTAPDPALRACIAGIDGLDAISGAGTVLLAVSGGPDSMAMAHAFAEWRRARSSPVRLKALVVDHGLRPGSSREAAAVRGRLGEIGISATVAAIGEAPPAGGIQAWARHHRYRLLIRAAAPDGAVVATAHHRGDQAETVLMRLRRGSGLAGLAGIEAQSRIGGVTLVRPFLGLDAATLRGSLEGTGIPVVEDPSNRDRRYERVRVRQELDATGAGALLCRLAGAARGLNGALRQGLAAAMAGKVEVSPLGYGWIDHAAFAGLPGIAAETLLRGMVGAMATAPWPVPGAGVARLADNLRRGRPATLGGCEWRLSGEGGARRIVCHAEAERLPASVAAPDRFCLFDRRWQVFPPRGFPGRIEAIGAERFAALRRADPRWAPPSGIPARAFWRLPVLVGGAGGRRFSGVSLDESTIVPHLLRHGDTGETAPVRGATMRFAGGRGGFSGIGL